MILASASPRRKELLEKEGISFVVEVPDIDETPLRGETPPRMVARLSREKARTIAKDHPKEWVLAADTTVVSPAGKNLGKPKNRAEAMKMLAQLQGKTHSVYTAYTWARGSQEWTRTVCTRVTLRKLSRQEMERYVDQGECLDKAGAYAAQGVGMVLIAKISGSYTNVVGLPIAEVITDFVRMNKKRIRKMRNRT